MGRPKKTKHLKDLIFKEIESGNFPKGSMIPSDRKLSEDFDASYMTVRRAVNLLVEDGILKRIAKAGTIVVNDIPEEKLKPLLGMVMPAYSSVENAEMMMYMAEFAEKSGWRFKVTYVRNWDDRAIGDAIDSSDAVVCYPVRDMVDMPKKLLDQFKNSNRPSVFLRTPGDLFQLDSVFYLGKGEVFELCKRIYNLGHRQIAEVIQMVTIADEKRPLGTVTLKMGETLRTEYSDVEVDDMSLRLDVPFFEYPSEVLVNKIVEFKDNFKWSLLLVPVGMYWGAMHGLKKIGLRVPDDVSIVCIGDHKDAYLYSPEPTRLSFKNRRMIELAMELVLWRRENPEAPVRGCGFSFDTVSGETLGKV